VASAGSGVADLPSAIQRNVAAALIDMIWALNVRARQD